MQNIWHCWAQCEHPLVPVLTGFSHTGRSVSLCPMSGRENQLAGSQEGSRRDMRWHWWGWGSLNHYSKRGKQCCHPHYTAQETGTRRVSGRALVTAVLWFWGLGYIFPPSSSVTRSQVGARGSPCRNLRWSEAPGWATVMVPSCSTSLGFWHSGSVKTQTSF